MDRLKTQKVVALFELLEHPGECSYFIDLELMKSLGKVVCVTCQHFTYTFDKSCVTFLTYPVLFINL